MHHCLLRTCIAVGEPASSSVSSHSLNHLSSSVLAARNKPLNTVLPFRPKEMAKSQRSRLAWSPEVNSAQRLQRKLCPNFRQTQQSSTGQIFFMQSFHSKDMNIDFAKIFVFAYELILWKIPNKILWVR